MYKHEVIIARRRRVNAQLVLTNVTVGDVTVAPFDVACTGGMATVVDCAIAVVAHNEATTAKIAVDDDNRTIALCFVFLILKLLYPFKKPPYY